MKEMNTRTYYKRKKKKYDKPLDFCTCPECGYNNQPHNVAKFGTCLRCGSVIDPKAKYKYEMVCRLRLWRNKKGCKYRDGDSK